MKRILTEDAYVGRFFRHVQERGGNQAANAVAMIVQTLKWRKETGIGQIKAGDLDAELRDKVVLFSKNRDVDGKKLLIFHVSKHAKGKNVDANKNIFLYWIERLEREERGGKISLFYDCNGAGLGNLDIEFMRFQINVMEQYIPDILNYILVFQMPWVLNGKRLNITLFEF